MHGKADSQDFCICVDSGETRVSKCMSQTEGK